MAAPAEARFAEFVEASSEDCSSGRVIPRRVSAADPLTCAGVTVAIEQAAPLKGGEVGGTYADALKAGTNAFARHVQLWDSHAYSPAFTGKAEAFCMACVRLT